jgi:hypothetical protein
MNNESGLGLQVNEANIKDDQEDKKFQDFLKSPEGKAELECWDEALKGKGNLTHVEIDNFPKIKCKKS